MKIKDVKVKKIEKKDIETEEDEFEKFVVRLQAEGFSGTFVFDEKPELDFRGGDTIDIEIQNLQKRLDIKPTE